VAIRVHSDIHKIQSLGKVINTIGVQLKKEANISSVLDAAHNVTSREFVKNMTNVAFTNPRSFGHMYEWNSTGDPNSRLWNHVLQGRGKSKTSTFRFKASKTTVPVDPALAAVGVKKRHIFYWKAPVIEYAMPVRISPKLAKVLVYLQKSTSSRGKSNFNGWTKNGIVYRRSPVYIDHAGSKSMWGSFTREYQRWFSGNEPLRAISNSISRSSEKAIKNIVSTEIKNINKSSAKVAKIDVMAFDPTIAKRLQNSLDKNYAAAAGNRMIDE
jgi:hypothetical protein